MNSFSQETLVTVSEFVSLVKQWRVHRHLYLSLFVRTNSLGRRRRYSGGQAPPKIKFSQILCGGLLRSDLFELLLFLFIRFGGFFLSVNM